MKNSLKNFKKIILGSVLALPVLFVGAKNVQATTVATVHSNVSYASLYTNDGFLVKNRALAPNTPWIVGKTITLNSRPYYQVATNEYVDSELVDISGNDSNTSSVPETNKLVGYAKNITYLVNDKGEAIKNRALASESYWQVGNVIQNKNGDIFFQVATNEYVRKADMTLNMEPNIKQVSDFGINENSNSNTNNGQSDNNSQNNNQSNNNSDNGNSSTTPEYHEPEYIDADTIDTSAIKQDLIKQINDERAKIGSKPVTEHPYLMSTAQARSAEAVQNYSHERPDGTNWDTIIDNDKYLKTRLGENLVIVTSQYEKGTNDVPDYVARMATSGFKSDPLHYGVMTDKYFVNVGIGVTLDKANNRFYIVEHFWD